MSRIKCVVVGDMMSGKTALLQRCRDNNYDCNESYPTVCGQFNLTLNLDDDISIDFEIWDTSECDEYEHYRFMAYKDAEIVLICYSIQCERSFMDVRERWIPEIHNFLDSSVPIILVASKLDLRDRPDRTWATRAKGPFSFAEGFALARQIGAVAYVECSSLDGTGVKLLIDTLIVIAKEIKENKFTKVAKVTKRNKCLLL